MKYNIRYSPQSLKDLVDVFNGVYEASKDYKIARDYIDGLFASIREKQEFPLSGIPLLYRNIFSGFYSINYKKYKVFYRVKDDGIDISRILLAKQDYINILFKQF